MTKRCKQCGKPFPDGAAWCNWCGPSSEEALIALGYACKDCGATLPAGRDCPFCANQQQPQIEQVSPQELQTIGSLPLLNLSLGIAFALSSLFSIGPKLLSVLGISSALRLLQPYQQHLLQALISYWLPAIIAYLAFRISRVDSRLRPTPAVHAVILIGNLLLVLYLTARVFASTVQGGGASFAVMSFSPIFIFPAWGLLAFGLFTLARKSFRPTDSLMPNSRPKRVMPSDIALLTVALLGPLGFGMTLPVGKIVTLTSEFGRLCQSAEIKILEQTKNAKSIAVLPDMFTFMAQGRGAETTPFSAFLLNQSLLEFVEIPSTKSSGLEGKATYQRVSTVGERVLRSPMGSNKVTQFVYEPTDNLTAEYVVRPIPLPLERGSELGLGGARIEIRKRNDNHLVAYAQYYWNNTEFKACPEESHNGMFIYHFVAGALNVKNPDGPK